MISKRQIVHGACAIVPEELDGAIVSNEYSIMNTNGDLDTDFLNYLADTLYFQQTCFHSSIGVHVEKMIFKLEWWYKWLFNLPPILEQTKISNILATWDRAIETTERLIENSRQQKKALMQRLLRDKKRLPGFEGEFKRFQLKEVADVDKHSLGTETPEDFAFKYISLSDVGDGKVSSHLTTHQYSSAPSRARRMVSDGDILMATVRPNLQAFARIDKSLSSCVVSTGFAVLSPRQGFDPAYIYHYLFGGHMIGQLNALVVGSNYPAINSSDVKGLAIYCPPYDEQKAISQIFDAADRLAQKLQDKQDHQKLEKQALVQQLLTGKRRVKVEAEAT